MSLYITESFTIELPDVFEQFDSITESQADAKLIIELAAIHEGLTANYNFYTAKVLEEALSSWVQPYPKPILINHDKHAEPLGRVMAAKMDKDENGVPFVRLQVGITDSTAVQKVKDKRYLTGSVGGSASSASCSICETELANQSCRHAFGKVYNGKLAYRKVNDLKFHEYSFVNVPGDSKSIVLSQSDKVQEASEDSEWIYPARVFALDMNSQRIVEFTEAHDPVDILGSMSKKTAYATYNNLKGTWISLSALDYVEEQDQFLTNKNTENVTHSIIDNTMNMEESSSDDKSVLETEQDYVEERKMPEDVLEAEEDLLDVIEQLSNDLASNTTDEVAEDAADTDTDVTENTDTQDMVEDSTVETDESDENSDGSEAEIAEDESETIDEVTEETDEQLTENTSDEQAELDSTEVVEDSTTDVDALVNENTRLKEENTKLKGVMHKMLAERVVDKKIDCGLVESTQRGEAITEHATRTASSLADALKDLSRMPKFVKGEVLTAENFSLGEKVVSTETSDNSIVESDEKLVKPVAEKNKADVIEEFFTDVLMGRKAL